MGRARQVGTVQVKAKEAKPGALPECSQPGVRGQVSPCRHVTVSTVSRTNVVQVRPNSPATTASGVASEPACLQRAPVAFSLGLSAAVGHRRHRAGACCSWGAPAKLAPHMRQVRARPVDDEEPNDPAPVQQQRYGECDRQVVARRSGAPAQVCACIYQDWACLCVRATLRRRPKARGVQRRRAPRTFQTGTLPPSRRPVGRSSLVGWHRAAAPRAEQPVALQEGKVHSVREPPPDPEALLCTLRSRVFCRRGSAVFCPGMSAELFFTEGPAGASALLQQMVYWLLVSLFWIVVHVWTELADRPHTAASWCGNVTKECAL